MTDPAETIDAPSDDGEGPVTAKGARARAGKVHGRPEHSFRPGPDGKDPRDERTRSSLPADYRPEE